MKKEKDLTSQTIIASWLVPFLPCWVNKDATSLDPFRNSLPGILWRGSSLQWSKEELLDPSLFLEFFRFLIPEGELGSGLLLSAEKQDPILRNLRILRMHSRPTEQPHPLYSIDGSVTKRWGKPWEPADTSSILEIIHPLTPKALKYKMKQKVSTRITIPQQSPDSRMICASITNIP